MFKLQIGIKVQAVEIDISGTGFRQPGQVILPVGPPCDIQGGAGQAGPGPDHGLVIFLGAVDQAVIVIIPWFVVVIDDRQVWIMENVDPFVDPASGCQFQPFALQGPAAPVNLLVFPFSGIPDPGFALHIVEPHVFGAFPVGPYVLAGNAARMTADALVQVHHHGVLHFNLHTSPPFRPCAR